MSSSTTSSETSGIPPPPNRLPPPAPTPSTTTDETTKDDSVSHSSELEKDLLKHMRVRARTSSEYPPFMGCTLDVMKDFPTGSISEPDDLVPLELSANFNNNANISNNTNSINNSNSNTTAITRSNTQPTPGPPPPLPEFRLDVNLLESPISVPLADNSLESEIEMMRARYWYRRIDVEGSYYAANIAPSPPPGLKNNGSNNNSLNNTLSTNVSNNNSPPLEREQNLNLHHQSRGNGNNGGGGHSGGHRRGRGRGGNGGNGGGNGDRHGNNNSGTGNGNSTAAFLSRSGAGGSNSRMLDLRESGALNRAVANACEKHRRNCLNRGICPPEMQAATIQQTPVNNGNNNNGNGNGENQQSVRKWVLYCDPKTCKEYYIRLSEKPRLCIFHLKNSCMARRGIEARTAADEDGGFGSGLGGGGGNFCDHSHEEPESIDDLFSNLPFCHFDRSCHHARKCRFLHISEESHTKFVSWLVWKIEKRQQQQQMNGNGPSCLPVNTNDEEDLMNINLGGGMGGNLGGYEDHNNINSIDSDDTPEHEMRELSAKRIEAIATTALESGLKLTLKEANLLFSNNNLHQ